jgi:hypothetical protein
LRCFGYSFKKGAWKFKVADMVTGRHIICECDTINPRGPESEHYFHVALGHLC